MKKRILPTILFCLAMVLSFAIPSVVKSFTPTLAAFEVDPSKSQFETTYEGIRYTCTPLIGGDFVSIGYYQYDDEKAVSEVNGRRQRKEIEVTSDTVHIPSAVANDAAVPFSVVMIDANAFNTVNFSEPVTLSLPDSIQRFGYQAFLECGNLQAINIPPRITEIPDSCFMGCKELTSVTYSCATVNVSGEAVWRDSKYEIERIGRHAFSRCESLRLFTMPSNLRTLDDSAFQGCRKLVRTNLSNPNFTYVKSATANESVGTENVDGTNTLSVGKAAFADCKALALMHVGKKVTEIGDYAFQYCDALTLYFQDSSSAVSAHFAAGEYSAKYDRLRINVDNGALVKKLFNQNTFAADDYYPDLVFTITPGGTPIKGTVYGETFETGKTGIYKDGYATITAYNYYERAISPEGSPIGTHGNAVPIDYYGMLTIPEYVSDSFTGTGTKYPVAIIAPGAFNGHSEITGVTFNKSLVSIQTVAFSGCSNLGKPMGWTSEGLISTITTLDFSQCEKLREIGPYAFTDSITISGYQVYSYVESIILPKSLRYLGDHAFNGFILCTELDFYGGATASDPSVCPELQRIYSNCFQYLGRCPNGGTSSIDARGTIDTTIPCQVINIAGYGFYQASGLRRVKFADEECQNNHPHREKGTVNVGVSLTIDGTCFTQCHSLQEVIFSCSLASVSTTKVFESCYSLRTVYWKPRMKNLPSGKTTGTIFNSNTTFGGAQDLVIYVEDFWQRSAGQTNEQCLGLSGTNLWITTFTSSGWKTEGIGAEGSGWHLAGSRTVFPYYFELQDYTDIKRVTVDTASVKGEYHYIDGTYTSLPNTIKTRLSASDLPGTFRILTHFYSSSASQLAYHDLSQIAEFTDAGTPLKVIGNSAFANSPTRASYAVIGQHNREVILPDTIVAIDCFAFFSSPVAQVSGTTAGGRFTKVTYRSGGTVHASIRSKTKYFAPGDTVKMLGSYCAYLGEYQAIELPASLKTMGICAVSAKPYFADGSTTTNRSNVEYIDGVGSAFETETAGSGTLLYGKYTEDGETKYIVEACTPSKITGSVKLRDGTTAIGPEGLAGIAATSLTLPEGFTTIYGAGLWGAKTITEINGKGLSTLKYIGVNSTYLEEATDILDKPELVSFFESTYRAENQKKFIADKERYYGAMSALFGLTDFFFTEMSGLRMVANDCFYYASSFAYSRGRYTYNADGTVATKTRLPFKMVVCTYSGGKPVFTNYAPSGFNSSDSKGILDLSQCTSLAYLEQKAIRKLSLMKEYILPAQKINYNMTADSNSHFYGNSANHFFIGESYESHTASGVYRKYSGFNTKSFFYVDPTIDVASQTGTTNTRNWTWGNADHSVLVYFNGIYSSSSGNPIKEYVDRYGTDGYPYDSSLNLLWA